MLLGILSYLDNYLLYSEDNTALKTALEGVVNDAAA